MQAWHRLIIMQWHAADCDAIWHSNHKTKITKEDQEASLEQLMACWRKQTTRDLGPTGCRIVASGSASPVSLPYCYVALVVRNEPDQSGTFKRNLRTTAKFESSKDPQKVFF